MGEMNRVTPVSVTALKPQRSFSYHGLGLGDFEISSG